MSGWKAARGLSSLHRRERLLRGAPHQLLGSRQKGYPEANKHSTEDQRLPSTLPGRDPAHSLLDLLPSAAAAGLSKQG